MPRRIKSSAVGRIEKPEDKSWQEWYNGLDVKQHENYLSKLGLDREEINEWEEAEGFKKPKKKK